MARDEIAEAIFVAYVMAAIWGAGNEAMPLAAGTAHGSVSRDRDQDRRVFVCPVGLLSFALMMWGLRGERPSKG